MGKKLEWISATLYGFVVNASDRVSPEHWHFVGFEVWDTCYGLIRTVGVVGHRVLYINRSHPAGTNSRSSYPVIYRLLLRSSHLVRVLFVAHSLS